MSRLPRFNNPALLEQALTHRSYAQDHRQREDNERLEFLGDGVLNMLAAEWLYKAYPHMDEGKMSRLRATLVSREALAFFAVRVGVHERIKLGRCELHRGDPRVRAKLIGDAFEAIIGAIYLDQGLDAVRRWLTPLFAERHNELRQARNRQQVTCVVHIVLSAPPPHQNRRSASPKSPTRSAGR